MSFWGSFTGSSQRKDLRRAQAQATQHLDQGYSDARSDYTGAIESYQPYVESGTKSQSFYDDLLGLNGSEARAAAQGTLTSDPLFQGQLAQSSNAMLRHLNARGSSVGGKAALAGQRVLQQTYGDWLDRYQGGGAQGLNATNAMAGYRADRGDLAWGHGTTIAGNAISHGNAMAQSRGILSNNLLKIAEIGVNAMTGLPRIGS